MGSGDSFAVPTDHAERAFCTNTTIHLSLSAEEIIMFTTRIRRAGVVAAAIAATAAGAIAGAPGASAVTVFESLDAAHSGKVLDVKGASTANNAHVIQFGFHGGENQQWKRIFVGAPTSNAVTGDFVLQNRHSQKCLDVENHSKAVGAHLVQTTCNLNGGIASQRWFVHKVADKGLLTGKGFRWYFNRNSGQVIDIANASPNNGALAIQFPQKSLANADNQLFHVGVGGVG